MNIDFDALTGDEAPVTKVSNKQEWHFRRCLAASERIDERGVDILGSDPLDREACAESLASLGEQGQSIWLVVARQQSNYDRDVSEAEWQLAIQKSKRKTPSVFYKLCKEAGIDTQLASSEEGISAVHFLPKEADEDAAKDLEEFGFFAMNHAYYKMNGSPTSGFVQEAFSNFTIEVLYHIYNGTIPRRVVRLTNNRGREVVVDVPTKALTGMNAFKEFTEGLGNFLFWGSQINLTKLKNKLFEQEKSCMQIETLGWHTAGFFAFCNGIYGGKFMPVDENGVVSYKSANYYIPSGNENYKDDPFKYANEKKFRWTETDITFDKWEPEYVKTYGEQGRVMLLYTLACLFSDIIYKQNNNFPILFFFGEGGSGKSSMINSAQHLFGKPQDPLKISEKANTDKAKIRKLAQFVNALACLEEYTNKIPQEAKNTLRGLYDRFGYERGNLEGRFSTESVPINSGVAITGNEYPDDDPLLQRCILMEYNRNQFTNEEKAQFDKLRDLQEKGITSVTCEVLSMRDTVQNNFHDAFKNCLKELKELMANIHGLNNRIIENYAVIAAIYKVLDIRLAFSFKYNELTNYMVQVARYQAEKRDSGGETQKFWDIMLYLLTNRQIRHNREFTLNGNQLNIRFKEVHQYYLMAHKQMYSAPGLNASTMLEKLKNSEAYDGHKDSQRFDDKKTSSYQFKYDKVGVDLLNYIDEKDPDSPPKGDAEKLPF